MQVVRERDALVIGAGFSGLYMLLCLRDRLGLDAEVLEMAGGVGGTWYWNRYPGARCDSESYSYCYGFSPELLAQWEWSERYPGQAEILRYLDHVADRFDLRRSISFDTKVVAAEYDAAANKWLVRTAGGDAVRCTWLITAVGCLSSANVPDLPGLEGFAGQWFHTGLWPQEGVDFSGKRVGQIGTGSTGIQSVPVIAEQAGHLTVFQRTANFSIPARNAPLTPAFKQHVKDHAGAIRALMVSTPNGHPFAINPRRVFDVDAAERERIFEEGWARGGLQFRAAFHDLLVDQAANDEAASFIKRKIRAVVADPATAALLADIDHPFAAKRPPIDSDYFEAFNRDNVRLVDVRADPIAAVTPGGVRLASGREFALDIIVFATGFDAMTGPLLRMDIRGRDGLALKDAWAAGPETYLGLQVAGFPNLFTMTGPGSPSVLCNMPVAIEQHAEWIADCIAHVRARGLRTVEATVEAAEAWGRQVAAAAAATLLPKATHSWYLGANVPGKPRVFMPYAGGMARYREHCAEVAAAGYDGFALGG
ncbi:MAG: NAD(P)/FAD-dependent oxidoreductase [Acetobacteraceae bacterium]|nr:NAD(P)/FAD-dependent oxidoreductase [Acetobacteraceae bacterium]